MANAALKTVLSSALIAIVTAGASSFAELIFVDDPTKWNFDVRSDLAVTSIALLVASFLRPIRSEDRRKNGQRTSNLFFFAMLGMVFFGHIHVINQLLLMDVDLTSYKAGFGYVVVGAMLLTSVNMQGLSE
jgi:hypothetical protein